MPLFLHRVAYAGLLLIVTALTASARQISISEPVCAVSRQQMVADKYGVYTAVEQPAEFPGGMGEFYKFISKNFRYPAKGAEVQGRVFISFIVEKNGSLTNFKVLRGLGNSLDEEAIRILKLSPKWKPGRHNGTVVRQLYTVPIACVMVQE